MDQDDIQSPPHTIISSLVQRRSLTTSTQDAADVSKRRAIIAILTKLSMHYWRPDFTPGQAKQLLEDYVDDIMDIRFDAINIGIRALRQSKADFFPRSAEVRAACLEAQKEIMETEKPELASKNGPCLVPEFGESRPSRWWQLPKGLWKSHWRDDEIPVYEREIHQRWLEAKEARSL